ncbi:Gfo/Idh/MocA family protein [Yoonia sediminilitoris]|uniref:Putative dehydrogenase n=1 Tax=Yoonia sediminilitoris TaxID=1286148 RepID=A0A2T6KPQ6_9RHOB|nr:Gfo/Idh/MocA family oxidoreductase [Yoonia sediminilitoris]PUB18508.1 putative dehydrogenase [Yoonia sediminilitoris]RCW98676.1 putative dehydrogenase [Yoonia sediminilitoris]
MSAQPISTVAIIGAGMVAKTHVLALADLQEKVRLGGVFSRTAENAATLAAKATADCGYPVATYPSIDAICADNTIDWVIVLTPPNARTEIVSRLAAAGKAILLEKPIERDLEAATHIVETCENAGVPLGVVFQHRMRQASRDMAALVAGGDLGALAIAEVIVPWWREQSYYDEPGRGTYARDGGGVLISQAIHSLDLMLSLTGPVAEVQTMAHTTILHEMEAEDYVTAGLRFANGAAGSLIASTALFPGAAESITLHFEQCVATLQSGELRLKWRDGRTELRGESTATGGGADPMAFTHAWHRDVIADFADSLRTRTAPAVTGRDALHVHGLITALLQSSDLKRAISVPDLKD